MTTRREFFGRLLGISAAAGAVATCGTPAMASPKVGDERIRALVEAWAKDTGGYRTKKLQALCEEYERVKSITFEYTGPADRLVIERPAAA